MANSSDPAPRRRSASDLLNLLGAATAPLRQSLAVSLSALGDNAQVAFARNFDSGYDPSAFNGHSPRREGGITVRNLSVRYGERCAFEGVTGEFPPASLTAVIGPNGAGKSSLLKTLAGIIRPTAGEVICAALARHRLAYLPQQDELDRGFPISVAELVALGGWRNFGSVRELPDGLAASVCEALAAVGLSTVMDRQIAELSVGQFQRALFARLLMQDADVILLDEPFASLDESTTEDLQHFLERWQARAELSSPCCMISTEYVDISPRRFCWRARQSRGGIHRFRFRPKILRAVKKRWSRQRAVASDGSREWSVHGLSD